VVVIPTCAEVDAYAGTPAAVSPALVWSGSLGAWYRFDLAVALARASGLPLRVLTRQAEEARRELGDLRADVATVAPGRMPEALRAGDVGLCLVRATPSKAASAP